MMTDTYEVFFQCQNCGLVANLTAFDVLGLLDGILFCNRCHEQTLEVVIEGTR